MIPKVRKMLAGNPFATDLLALWNALSSLTRTTLTSILLNINVATIKTKWERYLENRKEQTNNQDSNLLLTLFILELRIEFIEVNYSRF